jgi:hypothetical protein
MPFSSASQRSEAASRCVFPQPGFPCSSTPRLAWSVRTPWANPSQEVLARDWLCDQGRNVSKEALATAAGMLAALKAAMRWSRWRQLQAWATRAAPLATMT